LRPKQTSPSGAETAPPEAATHLERRRVRVRVRKPHKWYRRKRIRRRVLLVVGLMGILFLADGGWAASGVVGGLQEARTELREGAGALLEGDLGRAREAFQTARQRAGGAAGSLRHPSVWLADVLPGVGDDVDALQAIAASATEVAATGIQLVAAAEASGWDGSSIPGIEGTSVAPQDLGVGEDPNAPAAQPTPQGETPGHEGDRGSDPGAERGSGEGGGDRETGRSDERRGQEAQAAEKLARIEVDLEILRLASPHLRAAATSISLAQRHLTGVGADGLWYPVSEALAEARGEVGSRAELIRRIADLSELLPGFLGGEDPRRYFLAFQNLAAPRGSGGFLGVYGILTAEGGKLELERMSSVRELEGVKKDVDAPAEYLGRYRRFGGASEIFAANYSPDFRLTGRVLLDIYEASEGRELDGVVAVDPLWMGYALEATGPVKTPAWPKQITARNASRILQHDVFLLEKQASDAAQIALGRALIEGLLTQPLDPRALADAMSRAARERHLQVYAARSDEQGLLGNLGVAGSFEPGPNPVAAVWQDATNNKAGYFAHKEISHRVELQPDGSAEVSTRITLDNRAPDGPPSVLLGSGKSGDPPGYYAAYLNLYLPEGAVDIRSEVSDFPGLELVEREFGRPVVFELLAVPPGESIQVDVHYAVPAAAEVADDLLEYRMDLLPQPALRPESVTVEVVLPDGAMLEANAPSLIGEGRTLRFEGEPTVPRQLWVIYRPPD
jgi:hypothetical protein